MKTYTHILGRLFNTPLLLVPEKAEIIGNVVIARMRGESPMAFEVQEPASSFTIDGIAVVSISGSLVQRSTGMDAASGLRSYGEITADVDAAVADASVKGILLQCDTPGGEVAGAFDCADSIYRASQKKPVWAIAEDNALSAGYLLASQANRMLATQTGMVGSVGVIMMHFDQSQHDKMNGIKITTMFQGDRKADFNPHAPLSEEAQAWGEKHIAKRYGQFVSAVVRGRRGAITAEAVRGTEAALLDASEAIKLGLIDGKASFREALKEFASSLTPKRSSLAVAASATTANPQKRSTKVDEENNVDLMVEQPRQAPVAAAATPPALPDAAEMRKQIEAQVRAEHAEIGDLCALANQPAMAVEFITAGKKPAAVRAELLALKAAADPAIINTAISHDASTQVSRGPRLADRMAQRFAKKGAA